MKTKMFSLVIGIFWLCLLLIVLFFITVTNIKIKKNILIGGILENNDNSRVFSFYLKNDNAEISIDDEFELSFYPEKTLYPGIVIDKQYTGINIDNQETIYYKLQLIDYSQSQSSGEMQVYLYPKENEESLLELLFNRMAIGN